MHVGGIPARVLNIFTDSFLASGFTFAELEMSESFCFRNARCFTVRTELVVSTLVEKFVFEEGPHVTWEMSLVVRPVVTGERGASTQLPLKVSIAPTV